MYRVQKIKDNDRLEARNLSFSVFGIRQPMEEDVFVALDQRDTVRGFLSYQWLNSVNQHKLPKQNLYIIGIAVYMGLRRRGISTALLNAIEQEALPLLDRRISVYAHTHENNIPAQEMFAKAGYRNEGYGVWDYKPDTYGGAGKSLVYSKCING